MRNLSTFLDMIPFTLGECYELFSTLKTTAVLNGMREHVYISQTYHHKELKVNSYVLVGRCTVLR